MSKSLPTGRQANVKSMSNVLMTNRRCNLSVAGALGGEGRL
jgi:hypothetical protein